MRTRVMLVVEHPDDLNNVDEESILSTFEDAGDIDWKVSVESIVREPDQIQVTI